MLLGELSTTSAGVCVLSNLPFNNLKKKVTHHPYTRKHHTIYPTKSNNNLPSEIKQGLGRERIEPALKFKIDTYVKIIFTTI